MENGTFPFLFLIPLNFLIAIWLTTLLTAVLELSWAKIRKLDPQTRKKLISDAEIVLEKRINYRFIIWVLVLTNLAIVSVILYNAVQTILPQIMPAATISISIIATFLFVATTEVLGHGLLSPRHWLLLRVSMPVMKFFYYLLNPMVSLAIFLQNRLDVFQENQTDEDKATTEDEIISLVENDAKLQGETAALEASERKMIQGIFDLDETLVKEIMTPRVDIHALKLPSSIADVKKMIIECGHSRIPVYKERIDNIVGLIYAKDLLDEEKIKKLTSLEQLTHPPVFIPETKYVSELLEEFKQNKNQIAVIIDEYGGTAGIVTIEDILEEIVGEIQDEYDSDDNEPRCTLNDDGSLVTDARVSIDQINELLSTSISEEEDYDTIGGYITSELGRIPKPMEVVDLSNIKAQILEANDRKISRLRLTKIDLEVTKNEPSA